MSGDPCEQCGYYHAREVGCVQPEAPLTDRDWYEMIKRQEALSD